MELAQGLKNSIRKKWICCGDPVIKIKRRNADIKKKQIQTKRKKIFVLLEDTLIQIRILNNKRPEDESKNFRGRFTSRGTSRLEGPSHFGLAEAEIKFLVSS